MNWPLEKVKLHKMVHKGLKLHNDCSGNILWSFLKYYPSYQLVFCLNVNDISLSNISFLDKYKDVII